MGCQLEVAGADVTVDSEVHVVRPVHGVSAEQRSRAAALNHLDVRVPTQNWKPGSAPPEDPEHPNSHIAMDGVV